MIYTIFELAELAERNNRFADFIDEGRTLSPDKFLCRELEDFSPEAEIDTAYIESFAYATVLEPDLVLEPDFAKIA